MNTTATSDATATKLQDKEQELQETAQHLKEAESLCSETKSSLEREKVLLAQVREEKESATLGHTMVSLEQSFLPSNSVYELPQRLRKRSKN